MDVIDFSAHRKPAADEGGVELTFFGAAFKNGEQMDQLRVTVPVTDGGVKTAIEKVRELGGIWLPAGHDGTEWFLPWPPAAIRVSGTVRPK